MNGGPLERVAYAVTHEDEPRVFLAEDETVLSRVLAVELVAATERVWSEHQLDEERAGLELRVAPIFDDAG
jgi:hypothetical protein